MKFQAAQNRIGFKKPEEYAGGKWDSKNLNLKGREGRKEGRSMWKKRLE